MTDAKPDKPQPTRRRSITVAEYRHLAEFRYRIRRFLNLSEEAARAMSVEPQQHQLLLAIKGLPEGSRSTVSTLAERLCLRHHSTVELIDRLEKRGAVARRHSNEDHREVMVELTSEGDEILRELTLAIWLSLGTAARELAESLSNLPSTAPRAHEVNR